MSEYKRLTDEDLVVTINNPEHGDQTKFLLYAQRLWALENRIKSGEPITAMIEEDEHGYYLTYEIVCRRCELFDTAESAEKRLAELRGEK